MLLTTQYLYRPWLLYLLFFTVKLSTPSRPLRVARKVRRKRLCTCCTDARRSACMHAERPRTLTLLLCARAQCGLWRGTPSAARRLHTLSAEWAKMTKTA